MIKVRLVLAAVVFAGALAAPGGRVAILQAAQASPASAAPQETAAAKDMSGEEASQANDWKPVVAKAVNFTLLVAILVYFLRAPLDRYLTGRIAKVREDLVSAAQLRESASRQLAEIEQKLKTLPAEIETLRARGAEEIAAERQRIEQAAETERQRLLEHSRREIDTRLRVAKRELIEHAADLAVQAARDRITKTITPEDQARLVDRYTAQVQGARS